MDKVQLKTSLQQLVTQKSNPDEWDLSYYTKVSFRVENSDIIDQFVPGL